jgi:hypothetical protein
MSDTKPRKSGFLLTLLVLLACVGGAITLLANRQAVLDQLSVWQYTPSGEILSFAERAGMSDTGEFYFYTSHPSLLDASAFNKECDRKEHGTAILGCYNGQYIYIYNVPNQDLDGIREVTATHEMLHAAYDRMNDAEKQRISVLLEDEYNKLRADKNFAERMAFYGRTEPGERNNELHSIVGTEVSAISPALEAHYRRYFSDRSKVVALHQKYAAVFTELQSRADVLSAQLTELGDDIEAESAAYNKNITQFNQDVREFEQRVQDNGFVSQSEFDEARSELLERADMLDTDRQSINNEVARYNEIRSELMAIASESEALNRSIDSSLAPAPSL